MAKYLQVYEKRVYVPKQFLHEVLARCIRHEVSRFEVLDDLGGTGMWQVVFEASLGVKKIREIVGPKHHIEDV